MFQIWIWYSANLVFHVVYIWSFKHWLIIISLLSTLWGKSSTVYVHTIHIFYETALKHFLRNKSFHNPVKHFPKSRDIISDQLVENWYLHSKVIIRECNLSCFIYLFLIFCWLMTCLCAAVSSSNPEAQKLADEWVQIRLDNNCTCTNTCHFHNWEDTRSKGWILCAYSTCMYRPDVLQKKKTDNIYKYSSFNSVLWLPIANPTPTLCACAFPENPTHPQKFLVLSLSEVTA